MIPLSPRLLCCASMIQGDMVCDIGTDHAYLPAYLVSAGRCSSVIATDIKNGPLESARGTLKRYHAEQQVRLILSDGFEKVPAGGITDAVLAGMGGETIRDILAEESEQFLRKNKVNLILQPMTRAEVLRAWLSENGFAVRRETAVRDVHLYTVMQVQYTGDTVPLTAAQSYYGRLRPADPMTQMYLAGVLDRLQKRANGLEGAGDTESSAELRALIAEISQWMQKGESR